MSSNCVLLPVAMLPEISKDGAVAWGGTWDPTFNSAFNSYSNGNLTASVGTSSVRGTQIQSGGKHFFEVTINSWNSRYGPLIGIMGQDETDYGSPNSYAYWSSEGLKYHAGTNVGSGSATFTVGDRVGILFDQDVGDVVLYKNGVSQGTIFSGIPNQPMRPFATAAGSNYTANVTGNFNGPFS
jgi:hypothetical protein